MQKLAETGCGNSANNTVDEIKAKLHHPFSMCALGIEVHFQMLTLVDQTKISSSKTQCNAERKRMWETGCGNSAYNT